MIKSWADLEAFLANGGRMRFEPRAEYSGWSNADTGEEIKPVLATRALADGLVEEVSNEDRTLIFARKAAA